jgi:hypothetical protein
MTALKYVAFFWRSGAKERFYKSPQNLIDRVQGVYILGIPAIKGLDDSRQDFGDRGTSNLRDLIHIWQVEIGQAWQPMPHPLIGGPLTSQRPILK